MKWFERHNMNVSSVIYFSQLKFLKSLTIYWNADNLIKKYRKSERLGQHVWTGQNLPPPCLQRFIGMQDHSAVVGLFLYTTPALFFIVQGIYYHRLLRDSLVAPSCSRYSLHYLPWKQYQYALIIVAYFILFRKCTFFYGALRSLLFNINFLC